MVRTSIIAVALAAASTVIAQNCGLKSKCPKATPCCSQYGACGTGAYCLGGCDPLSSFSLDACVPAPVCKGQKFEFKNMDGITDETKYLGDSSKTDWVASGKPTIFNDNLLLTMPPDSVGTLLASSTYMWYGNVKARFKTSRGVGVVTAFILLSDVKDEIDYEFVGVDLKTAQSNFYFHGIPDYHNSQNISLTDTFSTFHTYEIQWTPDTVTWLIDGQEGRVLERKKTFNATTNQYMFPQTPARVQLSLWPGGLPTNGKGTIDWAGGLVDWTNAVDIKNNGYYYATFDWVEISCYDAGSSSLGSNKGTSYTYNNEAGTNNTVVLGDKKTVLKSLLGTGLDMDAGDSSASSSGTKPANTAGLVPGLNGADPRPGADSHESSAGSSDPSATAGASPSPTGASDGQFNQGASSSSKSGADKLAGSQEKVLKGSVFAGIVAVVAMMAL
ncbi:Concanavalin A-like lectin [Venustampulla echinocandica]|uniref:Crh-like protein n=1 Tax=Venustampulla echinocandica TaxID=2656787 RepID=A0A370TM37_9HELO|nr:Concanavalin A-like lectin [Venustampulla echinocandica]RDL36583.1 Concanavalin A-like lectin [Venustampulla echinocandica]